MNTEKDLDETQDEQFRRELKKEECPNCGRKLIDCCGNCIFDDLPNKGF